MMQDKEQTKEETLEQLEAASEDLAEAAEANRELAAKALENAEAQEAAQAAIDSSIGAVEAVVGTGHINEFVFLGAIFILAIFVGYYVVWSVTAALHTPLMSVTNAVSSVIIVGALIAVGAEVTDNAAGFWSKTFGFIGVALASVNIFGGFLVTQRMLAMYKKKER
jgi:NAD(P) transhydrogenase subunit alpha